MNHARLSPSSSSRWLTCTASVKASEKYENKSNSAAMWGTCVHYLGEQLLKGSNIEVGDELKEDGDDGVEFTVDKEMLECAEEYRDYVSSFITPKSEVLIEKEFDLSSISTGQFGTSDATVLNGTHLHVFDLKTGHNIVSAGDNTQLMLYAIGAVDFLEYIYDIDTITLHIVQTRAGHIDSWEITYDYLMEFKEFAKQQAHDILMDNVKFNPSKKACMWCPHKAHCEALEAHVNDTVKGAFEDLGIDNDRIKRVLDNADLIQDYIKSIQELAVEKLQNGEDVAGYKLVESRTNRKWTDEEAVEDYLHSLKDGVNYYQPPKLLPMTKILKILSKDKGIQDFVMKPDGKPTLAHISDKRQPILVVKDMFKDC